MMVEFISLKTRMDSNIPRDYYSNQHWEEIYQLTQDKDRSPYQNLEIYFSSLCQLLINFFLSANLNSKNRFQISLTNQFSQCSSIWYYGFHGNQFKKCWSHEDTAPRSHFERNGIYFEEKMLFWCCFAILKQQKKSHCLAPSPSVKDLILN